MITLAGQYLDGETSVTRNAQLTVSGVPGDGLKGHRARLSGSGVELEIPLDSLVVNSRVGSMPRRVSWGGSASFVSDDNDAADALQFRLVGNTSGLLAHRLERNLPLAFTALVVVAIGLAALVFWGVPSLARSLASQIPPSVTRTAAEQTLTALDKVYFNVSTLPQARQQSLRAYLLGYDSFAQRIEFRSGGKDIGANALALPAGFVVITDELVTLADNDEEILAVYLHEIGHARGHHAEASVLQSSAWLVILTFITGDVSGVSEAIYSLPIVIGQLAYSREFEREADDFAIAALRRHGVSLEYFSNMLSRLEDAALNQALAEACADVDDCAVAEAAENMPATGGGLLEYLSTHPATQERIKRITAAAAQPQRE